MLDGVDEESHDLHETWGSFAVLSVVNERVIFLQLSDIGPLRILPHGVAILPIDFHGLIVSLWD
jgi:hypothetical protein